MCNNSNFQVRFEMSIVHKEIVVKLSFQFYVYGSVHRNINLTGKNQQDATV
jgi:hypothetical protein